MDKINNAFSWTMAALGACTGFLFGDKTLINILLFFIVIDYLSGMIASYFEGKLSSQRGFRGIAKKVMLLLIVAAGHKIDITLGSGNAFRDAAIFFYLGNELLSIIENSGRIGLPVPEQIKRAVEVIKTKGEQGE